MYPVRKRFSVNVKDIFPLFPISSGKDRTGDFLELFFLRSEILPGSFSARILFDRISSEEYISTKWRCSSVG
jgi:hypothetical protein